MNWENRDTVCEEFEKDEQLQSALKYWQHILFLDDWFIKAELSSDIQSHGQNVFNCDLMTGTIKIRPRDSLTNTDIIKYCAEATLVHELLHMKLDYCGINTKKASVEEMTFGIEQHRKVEFMSRSFIMARYNLPKDWFSNV